MLVGARMKENSKNVRWITMMAMLLSLIFVLSILEGMLPPIPMLPPGVKLGIANVATMYALFFIGKKEAFCLAILKAGFVFMTRGAVAGGLSLCGGSLSLIIIILLTAIFKDKISYVIISIFGAVFHNVGQIIAASIILNNNMIFYYLPFLMISGVILGTITGIILRTIMPAFDRIYKQ